MRCSSVDNSPPLMPRTFSPYCNIAATGPCVMSVKIEAGCVAGGVGSTSTGSTAGGDGGNVACGGGLTLASSAGCFGRTVQPASHNGVTSVRVTVKAANDLRTIEKDMVWRRRVETYKTECKV